MKIDPNLEKIRDHHMKQLVRGYVGPCMEDAEDYLKFIHATKLYKMARELSTFRKHVKEYKKKG